MMGGMGGPPPGAGLPQENEDTMTNESINNPTENESNPQPPPQPGANPFASMFGGMDFNNIMNAYVNNFVILMLYFIEQIFFYYNFILL